MPSHAFHSHHLLRNVTVEAIYESNPVFASENVSVIIRFKHLGEKTDEEEEKEEEVVDDEQSWFGKKLSMQLTNSARALFLEEFNNPNSKEKEFNKSIDLFSGYVQLSGMFTYNDSVINHEKFGQIYKNTTISGKIGGLQGLEISKHQPNNLLNMVSNFLNTDIQSIGKTEDESNHSDHSSKLFQDTKNLVPFFSTNQSLLFSLINLKPGEIKNFYVNFKLPDFLPPTYIGNIIKINYNLIIGSSIDSKMGLPKPLVINFPLRVSAFFHKEGYQPIFNLNKFILLQSEKCYIEEIEDKVSFKQLKKHIETKNFLNKFLIDNKKDIFIKRIRDLQNNDDNLINEFKKSKVKENISQFSEILTKNDDNDNNNNDDSKRLIHIDGFPYERQINKFQTQYLINRDGKFITNLTFSKPFYKVGGSIKLNLNFKSLDNAPSEKVTGVLISLENLELISPKYSVSEQLVEITKDNVIHYRESFSTYNTTEFSISIPIPINSTSQFKTNIFESKWALSIKFVIAMDDSINVEAHTDKSGSLVFAKDTLAGQEFNCRLPVFIIPSDQEFGGIPL